MWLYGENYRLTKHGRKQYLKRVDPNAKKDSHIIRHCVFGCYGSVWKPVWKPEWNMAHPNGPVVTGYRLVTVIPRNYIGY